MFKAVFRLKKMKHLNWAWFLLLISFHQPLLSFTCAFLKQNYLTPVKKYNRLLLLNGKTHRFSQNKSFH